MTWYRQIWRRARWRAAPHASSRNRSRRSMRTLGTLGLTSAGPFASHGTTAAFFTPRGRPSGLPRRAWRAWCSGSPTSTEPIPISRGDAIRHARRGWAPALGFPKSFISSVSHDDAAAAVAAALDVPAGIYNVCDDRPVRRREFTDALAAALHVPPPRFVPTWVARLAGSLGETLARSQRIANRKLRGASPWAPRYPSVVEGWQAVLAELPR